MSRNLPLSTQGQVDFTVTAVDGTTGAPVPSGSESSPSYFNPAQNTYQLASSISLASAATTTPVTGVIGGSYIWNVVGTFSGGSTVSLQTLGSDGVTWQIATSAAGTPATVTASGNLGVVIGNNATVRLLGGVATTTALTSGIS